MIFETYHLKIKYLHCMSIYKKYNYRYLKNKTTLFENRLYFPKGCHIKTYNEELNENLFFFIESILYCEDENMLLYDYNDYKKLSKKEIDELNDYIIRSTRELIYTRIKSFYNYITEEALTYMGVVALELSCKIILGYDQSDIKDIMYICNEWLDENYNCIKLLNKFEIDLLKFSNYHIAPKMRKRLGDLPNNLS